MASIILVFGDSITWGAWDPAMGGWANRLRSFLESNDYDAELYNLGVSGDTTADLLERFEFETKQRLKECNKEDKIIIIFSIGANDSDFMKDKKSFEVPVKQYEQNLEKLIVLARKFSPNIVFAGLTPVDESKTNPLPWNQNAFCKNENIQSYDALLKSVCKKNKILFVETLDKLIKEDYKALLYDDGLHPNAKGHQRIFLEVKDFLIKNKII